MKGEPSKVSMKVLDAHETVQQEFLGKSGHADSFRRITLSDPYRAKAVQVTLDAIF